MSDEKPEEKKDEGVTPEPFIDLSKVKSHVVNQDEADGFDIDKQSGRFKDDKQSFTRIKDVRAEGPMVIIEIDPTKTDFRIHAAQLETQVISPQEAIQRALALNAMLALDKVNIGDRKQVEEIVEACIMAVMEAQENAMKAAGSTYEDIKAARRARMQRIEMFEHAVREKRGQAELDKLSEMMLFKKVLKKLEK